AGDVDANGQLVLGVQGQVEVEGLAAGVAVGDTGQSLGIVKAEELFEGGSLGGRGECGAEARDTLEQARGIPQHAGRLAGGRVLDDDAIGRVRRVPGYAGDLEGSAVDHAGRAGVIQDRVFRGGLVELGAGGETGLLEASREGEAEDDPVAGGSGGRL